MLTAPGFDAKESGSASAHTLQWQSARANFLESNNGLPEVVCAKEQNREGIFLHGVVLKP
jgi:hypothetical protein